MSPSPPNLPARYQQIEPIGSGGMGEVYKAFDTALARTVAIKVLRRGHADRGLLKEARSASQLNHPSIITIHEIEQCGEDVCLIMEFVEGRTLRASFRDATRDKGDFSPVTGALRQVAEALACAHRNGIVHRDVKPENIMVRPDGFVKLLDFGLAKSVKPDSLPNPDSTAGGTVPGTLLGTVRYMSPEQARGQSATPASDVFAIGVILYEGASGAHPFEAGSSYGVLDRIMTIPQRAPREINPAIPPELDALIMAMLEKKSEARPTADDVAAKLAQFHSVQTAPQRPRPLPPRRNLIGRSRETGWLQTQFREACAGVGRVICIGGEPGIGKTTLVNDFVERTRAEDQRPLVARGRCSERLAGSEAYLPFLEALGDLLTDERRWTVSGKMKEFAPAWYLHVATGEEGDSSEARMIRGAAPVSQERMKREFAILLQELSRLFPIVFFLDDLHWADASSIELLAYIGKYLSGLPVMILASYRPSEIEVGDHPLKSIKLEMQARGFCKDLLLPFLPAESVADYLALEFPENRFPEALAAFVHQRTEGNALFVVDLVRYLAGAGVLAQRDGVWELARPLDALDIELPESVRSMIEKKIAQLEEEDRRLLIAAAVEGQEFHAAIVAQALEQDEGKVEEELDRLHRLHHLVERQPETELPDGTITLRFKFVHTLYQNALYHLLTPRRRMALHLAVARSLERHYGNKRSEIAHSLAIHYENAREFLPAADYYLLAAASTATVPATQEAAKLYLRARAAAEKAGKPEGVSRAIAASAGVGMAYLTLGLFPEALREYEEMGRIAEDAGDTANLIVALCNQANIKFLQRKLEDCRSLAGRALELARQTDSPRAIAQAESMLAIERLCAGELSAAEEFFATAIPVLEKHGSDPVALDLFSFRAMLHAWRLEFEPAMEISRRCVRMARDLASGFHLVESHFIQGMAQGNAGNLSEALRGLEEGLRLSELNGETYWMPRLPNTIGWVYREMQDFEQALRHDEAGAKLARELNVPEGEANSHINLAHDYLQVDEYANALEHLQEAERLFGVDVWFRWRYKLRLEAEFGDYWMRRGDFAKAEQHLQEGIRASEKARARKHLAWAHKLLGDLRLVQADNPSLAVQEYRTALQSFGSSRCPPLEWKIWRALSAVEKQLRKPEAAEEALGRARAIAQDLGNKLTDANHRKMYFSSKVIRDLLP